MADETIIMGGAGETVVSSEGSTRVEEALHRDAPLSLRPVPLDFVAYDGESYTLECGDIVGTGGEGIVVSAFNEAGEEFVAKIAPIVLAEQADKERILQMLLERTKADPLACLSDHLMPICAWGTVFAQPLGLSREVELLVTIMPRCTPLEGRELSPSYVKTVVMPQLATAIQTLHDLNIVHRDVKPANVYLYAEKSIVLGDFGISVLFARGESIRNTITSRRTPGYTPHVHYVAKENDWYSLGYTLWTLYNGGVHPHQVFLEEERRTHNSPTLARVDAGERPVSFRPREAGDETFGQLVFGLTTVVKNQRLGYDDIQGYLADPAGFRYSDASSAPTSHEAAYDFDGIICHDKLELAHTLGEHWNRGKRHLYSRNVGAHLATIEEHNLSTALYEIVEVDDDTISNQDLGLAKAIWLISGDEHLLYWMGDDASFPTLVEAFGSQPVDELSCYDDALASGAISWSLSQLNGNHFEGLPLMQAVEVAARTQPRFARCLFKQLFVATDSAAPHGRAGFEAQMRSLFSNPRAVYELADDEAALDEELASLAPAVASLGTLSRLVSGRAELAKRQNATVPVRVETLLVLLDAVGKGTGSIGVNADKSDEVRAFAYAYGPKSAWLWAAAHSGLYKATDQQAAQKLRKLEEITVSEKSPVLEIMKAGDRARHLSQDMVKDMPRTPVNVFLGYAHKTHIECYDLDGFFCSSFYGAAVPRGFVRELLLKTPVAERASWEEVKLLGDACRDDVSKQDELVSALAMSLDDCKAAVSDAGTKRQSLLEIVISLALLVLVCVFFTRRDFVGMATEGFARTLAIAHVSLPEKAGLAVQAVAWSTFVFAGINFLISLFGYRWSAGAEKLVSDCQAMQNRAEGEKNGFVSGKSGLAQQIMDPQESGAIASLNLYQNAYNLSKGAEARSTMGSRSWYALAWRVSSFLMALGPTLYFGTTLLVSFHNIMNQLLAQFGTFFKMEKPPIVDLGNFIYLIILAVAFLYGYMSALSRVETDRRNAALWVKQVAYAIVRMILALVVIGLILMAISIVLTGGAALALAFTEYAQQHPMEALAIVVVIVLILRFIFR